MRSVVLLTCAWILSCGVSQAHNVIVDGNAAEWTSSAPVFDNTGHIVRDLSETGSFVWRDRLADSRRQISSPEREADLTEFRVTADPHEIYFLLRFNDLSIASGPNAMQAQIGIDVDRLENSGALTMVNDADTSVTPAAAWEHLLATRFCSNGHGLDIFSPDLARTTVGQSALNPQTDIVELGLPWSALGLGGPPTSPLRLSISLYRCDGTDRTLEIGSARQSNALDVVTNNHTPGAGINTSVELADQVLDYYVDVWFDANGEVISPLLISAVAARPDTLINAEWVELYNASSSTLPLSEFALGDEETPGASEAMVNFPSDALLLAPGQFVTVARSASAYQSGTGRTADYEIEGTDTTVRDMEPDPSWGSASFVLTDSGDQILLLDGQRTLVDAVTYGSGALPGVEPLDAPSSGRVEYRAPVGRDRNAAADFSPQTGDLSLIVNNHQTVLFNGDVATYIIEVFNCGPNAVANASITIDLLLGLDLEASDCVADTPGSHCIAIEAATRQGKFDLPMNGALHFAIKARVESGATNTALLQATLTPPPAFAERFPLDNKASDSDPITPNLLFADGFEPP